MPEPTAQLFHEVQEQQVFPTILSQERCQPDSGDKREIKVTPDNVAACSSSLFMSIVFPTSRPSHQQVVSSSASTTGPLSATTPGSTRLSGASTWNWYANLSSGPLPNKGHCQERNKQKLVSKQAIKEVREVPNHFLSQLFLVPKKDGSQRPVINLKPLNLFIKKQKFKMEGARVIRGLLQEGDWMVSIDLKDAYLSVPVAQGDIHYLCEFQYLRFGLSSAPQVFTKLLKLNSGQKQWMKKD